MSGPKVVRVVTREELVAAGEVLLSRLNLAVSEWQRCASDAGVSDAEIARTRSRRDELEGLLRADRFADFQQSASVEIGFLEPDTTRRREDAAKARALTRSRSLNGRLLAKTLLSSSKGLPTEVRQRLERGSRGELPLDELDSVLSEVNRSLFESESQQLSEEQKALVARLGDRSVQSLDDWKAGQVKADKRVQEMMADIAELELLKDLDGAIATQARLEEVVLSPDSADRSMRMDTLQMALRTSKNIARQKFTSISQIGSMVVQLKDVSSNSALIHRMQSADMALALSDLEAIRVSADEELLELQKSQAALARKRAVLDGLAQLGYTLHEGMATATTEAGGLVLRSPSRPGYGVRLSGATDMSRVQVRSVAFAKGRDAASDIAEEERWCGDFSDLKSSLASQGCQLVVEKAQGVGATPLKEVLIEESEDARRCAVSPASRSTK